MVHRPGRSTPIGTSISTGTLCIVQWLTSSKIVLLELFASDPSDGWNFSRVAFSISTSSSSSNRDLKSFITWKPSVQSDVEDGSSESLFFTAWWIGQETSRLRLDPVTSKLSFPRPFSCVALNHTYPFRVLWFPGSEHLVPSSQKSAQESCSSLGQERWSLPTWSCLRALYPVWSKTVQNCHGNLNDGKLEFFDFCENATLR